MSVRNDIIVSVKTAIENIDYRETIYPVQFESVSLFDEDIINHQIKFPTPLLMILDSGRDEVLVKDATHCRFRMPLSLRVFVKSSSIDSLHDDLNAAIASVRKFVTSNPTLNSAVLAFNYEDIEAVRVTKQQIMADAIIRCPLTYACQIGTY